MVPRHDEHGNPAQSPEADGCNHLADVPAMSSAIVDDLDREYDPSLPPTIATSVEPNERLATQRIRIFPGFEIDPIDVGSSIYSLQGALGIASGVRDGNAITAYDRKHPFEEKLNAYQARLSALQNFAVDDGYSLNQGSVDDFWLFVRTEHDIRKGSVVIIDNGNLRMMWMDRQVSQLGLQFLGNNEIQYVIFKQRHNARHVSRVAGRDTLEGVKRQIDAFDLTSMLYE